MQMNITFKINNNKLFRAYKHVCSLGHVDVLIATRVATRS